MVTMFSKHLWILSFFLLILAEISEGYHELTASDFDICSVGAQRNTTIDLVCRVQEQLSSRGTSCTVTGIKWYRSSGRENFEISTSSKYSILESVDDYGMQGQKRMALLRVRDFGLGDIARYSCHVSCDYGMGLSGTVHYHSDVCLVESELEGLQCPTVIEHESCMYNFHNGRCDRICDVRDQLYDGHDCAVAVPDCPTQEFCAEKYSDGVCHEVCNRFECQWDGGDCKNTALDLAENSVLIKVERPATSYEADHPPSHRVPSNRALAQFVSRVTHSLLRIVPVPRSDKSTLPLQFNSDTAASVPYSFVDSPKLVDNVVLKLDITECENRCLKTVDQVVQYLTLSYIIDGASQATGARIHTISVLQGPTKPCKFSNTSLVHLGAEGSLIDKSDSLHTQQKSDQHAEGSDNDLNTNSSQEGYTISVWIIVVIVIGALIIVGLLIAIFVVMVSIRREQRTTNEEKKQRIFHQSALQNEYNTCKMVDL